jgi:hypothetical protein
MGVLIGTGSSSAQGVSTCFPSRGRFSVLCCALDVLPHLCRVERSFHAKSADERPALVGEVDAGQVAVHGGSTAGQAALGVDDEDAAGHDHAQQADPFRA